MVFTTKYTKKPSKPVKHGLRFDKGGFVQEGPFDKYLSPYDKMRRSKNVEDRRDEDFPVLTHSQKEIAEEKEHYLNRPALQTRLGEHAGYST